MNPYRTSAEPLVACRPRRTLLGRLRSWWRARLVRRGGKWRDRYARCRACHQAVFRYETLDSAPLCYECEWDAWVLAGKRAPQPVPWPPDYDNYEVRGRKRRALPLPVSE